LPYRSVSNVKKAEILGPLDNTQCQALNPIYYFESFCAFLQ